MDAAPKGQVPVGFPIPDKIPASGNSASSRLAAPKSAMTCSPALPQSPQSRCRGLPHGRTP